ncbi:23S rRNA (pseudouridine(1915)-N(3))-methyltransferase RlmH [Pseudomethylobacillus aquaticus]|uniref:Ribosomal RNA large subunit methyltransferase H n=1 Tax=Pseudomethylobacillus aquaticus TaxID=2676064 RepID=A0A3N0UVL7_9PROT|nr:23S rRNA (pseudouridine(1915)-N(3))-methyltransferase RlmH [Pseudomethylobacillus aquaticus]ROH84525.1 23S rRNA (pseudouridine(1915)-N(3))-methyltransferase RlmH [Pseudomethylobacillus aquaticus]
MKLRIISVGHKMPDWVETACQEYLKRMPREASVEIVEIKPDKRAAGKNSEVVQEAEAKRIMEAVGRDLLVALDERGQEVTTLQLAERFSGWLSGGRDVALVVGGADGLHASLKQQANWLWSLSRLTLPHGMVRVLLTEQLYRAWSVINHHPYHRE